MLGAMAMLSVSASRQAEGGGGASDAGFSAPTGLCSEGLSSIAGASAGRGCGNGTAPTVERAEAGATHIVSSSTATRTADGRWSQPNRPQGHFRAAPRALNFMTIP
jgi:hypothetical protein